MNNEERGVRVDSTKGQKVLIMEDETSVAEGLQLAFAMDRSSYPDWIVPADDPIKKLGWEDGEEDY